MTVHAPARITQALEVVSDLGASATLVRDTGGARDAVATVELTRGEDGVTFSGFIDAGAGTYVLEIAFTGVVAASAADVSAVDDSSRRRFLGRITSDTFTVVDGATATPVFSGALDTIGRDGDGGDDDADGLGFLDELLLGTDVTRDDSDADGVKDGRDCRPANATSAFEIAEGGSFLDCDGDAFRTVDAPFGERGSDCDDEDAATNPGADDDCDTNDDEDCDPQTCPVGDDQGPDVVVLAPADGATIGCNAPFVVEATDPNEIDGVQMSAPDDPLPGDVPRVVAFLPDGGDRFVARNGFGDSGAPLDDGPMRVRIEATDNAANTTAVELEVNVLAAFPVIELSGPSIILDDAPVEVTLAPAAGNARPLATLELRAAPYDPSSNLVERAAEVVVGSVAPTGGTVTVDPASVLPGDFVLYPVAVDDIGNTAAPTFVSPELDASFGDTGGIDASFRCDGETRFVPAIVRRGDIDGPVTMRTHLDEAIAIARALDPEAYLTTINIIGLGADGTVDLARTDVELYVSYAFMTPSQAALSEPEGPRVTWFSAAAGAANPVVDPTGNFQVDEIVDVAGLLDTPVIVEAFACGGLGPRGLEDDTIDYERDVDGDIPNTDQFDLDTADGYEWISDATDLRSPDEYCYDGTDFYCAPDADPLCDG